MSERIRRLRWSLARAVAPDPIMADPCPGREAFAVHRTFGNPRTQISIPLDTLDIDIRQERFNNYSQSGTVTGTFQS